ncbi:MAG: InlB B-repeat-containing protein, partial [Paludibacteraceae bacterium]|nr:InlB B-repeat-containing protein [Paludibacteraceae bacterium]
MKLTSTNSDAGITVPVGYYPVTTNGSTTDMTTHAGYAKNSYVPSYVAALEDGSINTVWLFKANTGYIRVKKPNGRLYVISEGIKSLGGSNMTIQIGNDDPLTGEEEYINVAGKCPANHSSSYYRYESSSANSDGYMVRISAAQSKGSTWDWKAFAGYNTSSWIKKNNSVIEIDDASGKRWTEGGVDYFNVDYISTTRKVYHITNYPTDHVINATSVKCYQDETNGKAVMEVSDGVFTGTFNFAFDAFDNNVTIPAGTYTIGTDMNGQIYTANNSYSLTSGALTISKSGSNIIITTASVLQSSEPVNDFTLSANITPTKSDMIFIEADLALLQVSNSSGNLISTGGGSWFHLVGVDNTYLFNIETAGIPFAVRSFTDSEIDTGTEYTNFSENGNNIPLDIPQTRMTFSVVESKDMHNIYDVNARLVSSAGTYYFIHANAIRQLEYDEPTDPFPLSDMNLPNCSVVTQIQDDYDSDYSYAPSKETNPGLWLVSSQTEVNGYTPYARLAFKVNGNSIPTGAYNIRTSADGTMMVGDAYPMYKYDDMAGWPSENRGSAVVLDKDGSSWWYYLQTGTIYVSNISNNYYADIYGTTSTGSYVHFTMGAEPPHRTVIINEDDYVGGHIVEASTAFCLNDECTEFWQNMKIILTPHPRGGSTFTGWTGVNQGDIVDNGDGTYTFTVGARDYNNVSATFSSSTPTYTVTYNAGANGTGDAIADDTKEAGEPLTLSSSTYTRTGYTQTGWSVNLDGSTNDYAIGGTYSTDADLDLYPYWTINTYTVTVAKNNNGYGTLTEESDNVRVINNVPYGTVITTGTGENANKVTINGTTVTATPAASDAQYTYAFSGWTNGAATVTGNMTVTANFTRTVNTYDITFKDADGTTLKKSDGTTDAIYTVAYGATPAYDGATPTKAADSEYSYTFNGWDNEIVAVTSAATYTATYSTTKVQYTLTWDVNGGTTTSVAGDYTNGLIDWGTAITAPANPTKAGYTFNGWDADNDGTADNVAATMPTSDVTYKALWNAVSSDLVLKDGVTEGQKDINFDEFAATYNGQTMSSVTLNRTFTAGNWATLCLPFDVDESQLSSTRLFRKVYEFRYATGSADAGKQVTFHFRVATSMEAGRGYLVKGESGMNTSFTF